MKIVVELDKLTDQRVQDECLEYYSNIIDRLSGSESLDLDVAKLKDSAKALLAVEVLRSRRKELSVDERRKWAIKSNVSQAVVYYLGQISFPVKCNDVEKLKMNLVDSKNLKGKYE